MPQKGGFCTCLIHQDSLLTHAFCASKQTHGSCSVMGKCSPGPANGQPSGSAVDSQLYMNPFRQRAVQFRMIPWSVALVCS